MSYIHDVICFRGSLHIVRRNDSILALAGFRPNSEIIGKFRKLKKFYDHFVKRQK